MTTENSNTPLIIGEGSGVLQVVGTKERRKERWTEIFCFSDESGRFFRATYEKAFCTNASSIPAGAGLLWLLGWTPYEDSLVHPLGLIKVLALSNVSWLDSADEQMFENGDGWIDHDTFSLSYFAESFRLPLSLVEKEFSELIDMGLIERSPKGLRTSIYFNRNLRGICGHAPALAMSRGARKAGWTAPHLLLEDECNDLGLTPLERVCIGVDVPAPIHPSRNPEKGSIYLASAEGSGRYKIGLTTGAVKTRVKSFRTGSAFPIAIEFDFYAKDVAAMEMALHKRFDHCRVKGEWFYLSKQDISEIKAIAFRERWMDRWSRKESLGFSEVSR